VFSTFVVHLLLSWIRIRIPDPNTDPLTCLNPDPKHGSTVLDVFLVDTKHL
jgi:hypothetical protein